MRTPLRQQEPGDLGTALWDRLSVGTDPLRALYFNGDSEIAAKLGPCLSSNNSACRHDINFVYSWLGANQAERLTQGLLSLIVAIVYLVVLGPMAIGLMVISCALAVLVMLLGLTVLLLGLGKEQGSGCSS